MPNSVTFFNTLPHKKKKQAEHWQRRLSFQFPFLGNFVRSFAAKRLAKLTLKKKNPLAAYFIASNYPLSSRRIQQIEKKALLKVYNKNCVNAVWLSYYETRSVDLLDILKTLKHSATEPTEARIVSLVKTNKENQLKHFSADQIPSLIEAVHDSDPEIAQKAVAALQYLKKEESVNRLCEIWLANRSLILEDILLQSDYSFHNPAFQVPIALKQKKLESIITGDASIVSPLISACSDPDQEIATSAQYCIANLQNPAAVNEFCRIWVSTRNPMLESVLLRTLYLPYGSPEVRLFAALKENRIEIASKSSPEGVNILLSACNDLDQTISTNARATLLNLQNPEACTALCNIAVEENQSLAKEIALTAQYLPEAPGQAALFLLMTEQWQRYEKLDFDFRLMRAIYSGSNRNLRSRIAKIIQSSGKTDYLTILTGADFHSRVSALNDQELSILVPMLTENHEYQKLWTLALEIPIQWSINILKSLKQINWQPETEFERPFFDQLIQEIDQPMSLEIVDIMKSVPPALKRASLHVQGRVNAVAFAPDNPVLAIGTGNQKVVLWNYKEGRIDQIIQDFQHSIGCLAYNTSGMLFVGERTNKMNPCGVYLWNRGQLTHLGNHAASITSVQPIDNQQLITFGRDNSIQIWNAVKKQTTATLDQLEDWPRCACISPQLDRALYLDSTPHFISLPDLKPIDKETANLTDPLIIPSKGRCVLFNGNSKEALIGQFNGQVIRLVESSENDSTLLAQLIAHHSGSIVGLANLGHIKTIMTAGSEGEIRFFQGPNHLFSQKIDCQPKKLSSLSISPSEEFMAVGTAGSGLDFWDLRILDIPDLFEKPLLTAKPSQIVILNDLMKLELPQPIHNSFKFINQILQHRYRYDVELQEIPNIQAGEFDIILE